MITDFLNWLSVRRYKAPTAVLTLSDDEREELARLLQEPVIQKALIIAEQKRPPLFGDGSADVTLATIRGWEMHRTALLSQVSKPLQRHPISPTFPNRLGEEFSTR